MSLPLSSTDTAGKDTVLTNLPAPISSFIGRKKEIEEVKGHLSTERLVMLTGSGGCGKTRLALQVAAEVAPDYAHGVWLVELAPLADDKLVPQTVAQVLGVKEQVGQTIQQTLIDNLEVLCRTHRIERFALFDQFPYTDHLECGVYLVRR